MSNNLPTLLAELSEIAPDVCQKKPFSYYAIGDYLFWYNVEGDFVAEHKRHRDIMYTGQPAYDWLQGALQRTIKERGMHWDLRYWKPRDRYMADVADHTVWNNDATEVLLTAFIQAIKGEQ